MKRITLSILLCIFATSLSLKAQSSDIEFGLKAGANYSQFTPDLEVNGIKIANYKGKLGYYAGGFLNIGLSEKLQFQPELLLAMQGSRVIMEGVEMQGSFESTPMIFDFKSSINDLSLILPLEMRYFLTTKFFIEAGPQLGYIIDRKYKAEDNEFEGNVPTDPNDPNNFDYDKFEFGLNLGTGYMLADNLIISARYFLGLNERDNNLKSSVINLGVEFKL